MRHRNPKCLLKQLDSGCQFNIQLSKRGNDLLGVRLCQSLKAILFPDDVAYFGGE